MGLKSQSAPKMVVGLSAVLIFIGFAVTQAVILAVDHTDLPAPTSALEAIQNFNTPRFKNMAQADRDLYIAQSASFVDDLPGEKRREYFRKFVVDDECRNGMIKAIAQREFQKAVAYSNATTDQEKNKLLDAQIDKLIARFNALSPEFRDANRITIALMQTQPTGTNSPPAHSPFPSPPGGGWFSRIRNYTYENIEYQKPENTKIISAFQEAINHRLIERHITP